MTLLIDDPAKVQVGAPGSKAAELQCGPQHSRAILIHYVRGENQELGTSGIIRRIEFR